MLLAAVGMIFGASLLTAQEGKRPSADPKRGKEAGHPHASCNCCDSHEQRADADHKAEPKKRVGQSDAKERAKTAGKRPGTDRGAYQKKDGGERVKKPAGDHDCVCKCHGSEGGKRPGTDARKGAPEPAGKRAGGGPKGNNGVGNGEDPPPPGKAPVNDGPGTGPGNPGNKGGAKRP
jgi:hypothetical protein